MRLVNVSETQQGLEIAATGQYVEFGEEVDIDNAALADKLVATGLWAKTTSETTDETTSEAAKAAPAATEEGS